MTTPTSGTTRRWHPEPGFDLTTSYLGLALRNPLVASSSPLTGRLDDLLEIERAGAGAVVLPSLFEEQIEQDIAFAGVDDGFSVGPEAISGHAPPLHLTSGPDDYLGLVENAVSSLKIPVIASLNGNTPGGWATFATLLEDAGAHAVELNIYQVAAQPDLSGTELEDRIVQLVSMVRSSVSVPLAVKLGPHFSSMSNLARRLVGVGAEGLVLFNRFYQPDIDLDTLTVEPHLTLSTSDELRFVLRWMAILRGQLPCSLAATTGVHTPEDVVKSVLAGADVAMTTSALLRHGPAHLTDLLDRVSAWFSARGYDSVAQARGSLSQQSVPDPTAFERANYAKTLASYRLPS